MLEYGEVRQILNHKIYWNPVYQTNCEILGDVQLKNLVIKPSALDDLDLPVQIVYGKIGKVFKLVGLQKKKIKPDKY